VKEWYDEVECPECGSTDVDLAEEVPGPVFQCQECGEQFDPPVNKPPCPLTGTDGNVYSVIANVKRCLKQAGQSERAQQWVTEATQATSYDAVLRKTFEYVDPM
jgi:hypothetical protein